MNVNHVDVTNIDEEYVIGFLNNKEDIPIETKYKLGSCVTQLIVMLKHTNPTY